MVYLEHFCSKIIFCKNRIKLLIGVLFTKQKCKQTENPTTLE